MFDFLFVEVLLEFPLAIGQYNVLFVQAVKYLLSIPEIKTKANVRNKIRYTALAVLKDCDVCPRDFKSFEIQNILKEAGVRRSTDLNSSLPMKPRADEAQPTQSKQPTQSRFRRWWGVRSFLVKHWKHQGNWMEETHGTLMVVATGHCNGNHGFPSWDQPTRWRLATRYIQPHGWFSVFERFYM
jgi:hypothetical protein